jgi:3-oxoacyl-[acyl-carrier protein] reductase
VDLSLLNKTVLITGANNPLGIGAATALAFCSEGANVALAYKPMPYRFDAAKADKYGLDWYYKHSSGNADEVEATLKAADGACLVMEADISDPGQVERIYDAVEERFGAVDILVNNAAAYDEEDTIFTITEQGIDKTFAVNVKGTLLMTRAFVARFVARKGAYGRIINLSTDAAQVFAGQISYGASKAAIEAFTRAVAIEVGHLGITVNAVAPGPTQTGYIDEVLARSVVPQIPLGRLGAPEDIAHAIVLLASAKAAWITGQVLKVSGGHAL